VKFLELYNDISLCLRNPYPRLKHFLELIILDFTFFATSEPSMLIALLYLLFHKIFINL